MSQTQSVLPRQFSLREAFVFLTLVAIALAALQIRLHPLAMILMGVLIGWSLGIVFARRKRLILFASIGAILFPFASAPLWVDAWVTSIRRGPVHTFKFDVAPRFLAEDVAMEKARETLVLDGLDPAEWEAVQDGRSNSPDGVVDKYLSRNTLNPNSCTIQFLNSKKSASRIVRLELGGKQLTTYVWLPK